MERAADVLAALRAAADPADIDYVARFYAGDLPENRILGVRMPKVFPIARSAATLPLGEVEHLIRDPHYEVRMAAMAILDAQARRRLGPEERQRLLQFYLDHHDRIDNWDLVDRAAGRVVGEALLDGGRDLLDRLAGSDRPMERRTAIVATHAFLRRRQTSDTFRIGRLLASDPDPYVQKALASWVREAGKQDPDGRDRFLEDTHGSLPDRTRKAISK